MKPAGTDNPGNRSLEDYLAGKVDVLKKNLEELCLFTSRRYLERLSGRRKMKILFSRKDDWEQFIRRDFRYSRHQLVFNKLSDEPIDRYDLVVPMNIDDLKYLDRVRDRIPNNPLPIPTLDSLCVCDDKYRFNRTLQENGFGDFIPRMGDDVSYPYILKKKIDSWGQNSHIVLDRKRERELAKEASSPEFFRQEMVPGKREYATHVLYSGGRIIHSLNIEYAYEKDLYIKGKDQAASVSRIERQPYLDLFSSILDLVGFEGLCNVNYKIVGDRPLIFEINPRFGGSLSGHFFSFMKHLQ